MEITINSLTNECLELEGKIAIRGSESKLIYSGNVFGIPEKLRDIPIHYIYPTFVDGDPCVCYELVSDPEDEDEDEKHRNDEDDESYVTYQIWGLAYNKYDEPLDFDHFFCEHEDLRDIINEFCRIEREYSDKVPELFAEIGVPGNLDIAYLKLQIEKVVTNEFGDETCVDVLEETDFYE